MGKLYVIMGKSATGKDTIFQMLMSRNKDLKQLVTYTTRPIRCGETHGKEYYFVSHDELCELQQAGKVIECREYSTVHGPWFYFTADDGQVDFSDGDYVVISTLEGYEKLRNYYGAKNLVAIYLTVDDFTRLERAILRERQQASPCVAEVCRRFLADEADFSEEKLEELEIFHHIENDDMIDTLNKVEKYIKKDRENR